MLYFPIAQMPLVGARIVLTRASRGDGEAVAADMRRALRAAFPTAEPPAVMPGGQQLADQYHPWEVGAILFSALGVLALVVAALGVYSVVAYSISQRLPEMGIRLALGAQPTGRRHARPGRGPSRRLLGVALGIGGALAAGRMVQALLFDVSPRDPLVLAASAGTDDRDRDCCERTSGTARGAHRPRDDSAGGIGSENSAHVKECGVALTAPPTALASARRPVEPSTGGAALDFLGQSWNSLS